MIVIVQTDGDGTVADIDGDESSIGGCDSGGFGGWWWWVVVVVVYASRKMQTPSYTKATIVK